MSDQAPDPPEQTPDGGGQTDSKPPAEGLAAGLSQATRIVLEGASAAGQTVKETLAPEDGRLQNRQRRWDDLIRLEERLIRFGLRQDDHSDDDESEAEPPPEPSSWWRLLGGALRTVVWFLVKTLLSILWLVGAGLRLLADLGPTLRRILAGREADDAASDEYSPRFPRWRSDTNAPDRVGLALSGGGIRSATFNLGMLQKLDELKLLRGFDYLATVSGGGYIGGFWSAWLARQGVGRPAPSPFPTSGEGEPEPAAIRHLREFSNFLRPRLDLFSFSTGRILTSLAGAILPSIIVSLTLIALALGFWLALAWGLLAAGSVSFPGDLAARIGPDFGSSIFLFLATLAFHFAVELMWMAKPEDRAARSRFAYWAWAVSSSLVAAATWWFLWHLAPLPYSFLFRPLGDGPTGDAQIALAVWPLAAWATALAFLIVVRVVTSPWVADYADRARRAALGRALARVIFCLVLWAAGAAVWVAGQWLAAAGASGVAAAVSTALAGGGSFAWLRGLLSAQPNKPTGEGIASRLKPLVPKLIAVVTLGAAAAATASIVILIYQKFGHGGPVWFFSIVSVLALAACGFFEPHENGFHATYRERLARAYLGASNSDPGPLPYATEVREKDDLPMDQLANRPLHLVCCAANDLSADGLRTLHRGAESAVLSKIGLQVGDVWRRWKTTTHPDAVVPTLSQAMTASAAAFNSHMGGISMGLGRSATFLLAALGLRLGLWAEGPVTARERWRQRWAALQRSFPGLLFFRELLGLSRSRAGWIYLSDGAHFENLALYELVRRHCRYILVSDCGADPDVAFDDFGNAVRRVREDFGVEIDIDLGALRPKTDKQEDETRQPVVAGDIRYPGGDTGILLYVKPTLIGDEPEDITQYASRNREFPHETTLDQFYDEAQWEAYRRLGMHVIDRALGRLSQRIAFPDFARTGAQLVRVFVEARLAWPPSRPQDAKLLSSLDKEWTSLEKEIAATASPLRNELFPGLPRVADWSPASLADHLPHIQEALRLMSAVYLQSGLGDSNMSGSHPRYQGWLNRFGRWIRTYGFAAWWPWLSALQDRSFVEYLGREFGLPSSKKHEHARVSRIHVRSPVGPELDPWRLVKKRPRPDVEVYGYFDRLGPAGLGLLAATAELRVDSRVATLSKGGFRVPPGLWSLGIGETFLDGLVEEFRTRPDVDEIRASGLGSSQTLGAILSSLYVGAGFERDGADGGGFVFRFERSESTGDHGSGTAAPSAHNPSN